MSSGAHWVVAEPGRECGAPATMRPPPLQDAQGRGRAGGQCAHQRPWGPGPSSKWDATQLRRLGLLPGQAHKRWVFSEH